MHLRAQKMGKLQNNAACVPEFRRIPPVRGTHRLLAADSGGKRHIYSYSVRSIASTIAATRLLTRRTAFSLIPSLLAMAEGRIPSAVARR